MDETDAKLLALLAIEPRAPYRELADRLHVSIQAVHRRVQNLRDTHVLAGFVATLSSGYLNTVRAHVVGHTTCESTETMIKNLRAIDSVTTTLVSSGDVVHVNGLLRRLSDLEEFADAAKRAARIPDARVAIEAPHPIYGRRPGQTYTPLTALDMRIVRALHTDARRAAVDVAAELAVSAPVVRRHLDRMVRERSIEFIADIDPTPSGDVAALLSVSLRPECDKARVGAAIVEKHRPWVAYFLTFLNLPDFLVFATWTKSVAELEGIVQAVSGDASVESVTCNIALAGFKFPTWRDKLVLAAQPVPPAGD